MKVRDVMTGKPIHIHKDETVAVAARTLTHYNIGAVPVCDGSGRLCGMVTDRDMVTRCLAAGKDPEKTRIADVMTGGVITAGPDMAVSDAAALMGSKQVRRLPVVTEGRLCGIVSLADLAANEKSDAQAGKALSQISANISIR